jgi:hypothetical protein
MGLWLRDQQCPSCPPPLPPEKRDNWVSRERVDSILWPRRSVLFRDIQKPVEKGAIAKKLTELLRKKDQR